MPVTEALFALSKACERCEPISQAFEDPYVKAGDPTMSFDRPDVPKESPRRNLYAAIILVILAVLLAVLIHFLWGLAQAHSKSQLGNKKLGASIAQAQKIQEAPEVTSAISRAKDADNLLLLVVSDTNATNPRLIDCQLVSLEADKRRGIYFNIPENLPITVDGSELPLDRAYERYGVEAVIAPCARALKIKVNHVIIVDERGLQKIREMRNAGAQALVANIQDIMGSMQTDMTAPELIDYFERIQGIGTGNIQRVEL